MIIKKFQGKTEADASELARKELGEAVVIMNVRNIKRKGLAGIFRSPLVEVTVGLEEENERTVNKTTAMTALEKLAAKQKEINDQRAKANEVINEISNANLGNISLNDSLKGNGVNNSGEAIIGGNLNLRIGDDAGNLFDKAVDKGQSVSHHIVPEGGRQESLEEKLDSLETLLKTKLETNSNSDKDSLKKKEEEPDVLSEQMKFTKLLYNTMIDNEVDEKYANSIIEEAEKSNKPNMPFDYMLTNIYQKMILKFGTPATISPASKGAKVVFFVGPTGVGKTTTIAKIASKLFVEDKKKVALLTSDTYRIAATEQLKTYANILETPFRVVFSAADVEQNYEEFHNYDFILVDTVGHSHHNEEQKNNTRDIIHAVDGIAESEVYLVLSATTKYRDLISIADTYKEISDYKIIFTKLDETTALGNLLNLKLYTDCELSYVTYGQNVPNDIDKFNPQTTVKSILGGH